MTKTVNPQPTRAPEIAEFNQWNTQKQTLHFREAKFNFRAGQIWWCALGKNIGFEEDGKHDTFERPVLILRKIKHDLLLVAPLTSVIREGNYFYTLSNYHGQVSQVLLAQIRAISANRLLRYVREIPRGQLMEAKRAMSQLFEKNETSAKRRNLGGDKPQLLRQYNKPRAKSQARSSRKAAK
jgi:mRNA interferase MazF